MKKSSSKPKSKKALKKESKQYSKQKPQLFFVHGGTTFRNDKDYLTYLKTRTVYVPDRMPWHGAYLTKNLGKKFELIRPRMPLPENAKYRDWKIFFERHIPYLRDNVVLVGNSLGGNFLAKYLSENKFPRKILAVYMICTAYDNDLPSEELLGGFGLKKNLSLIEKNCDNVTLMFSKDDDSVPVSHAEKFRAKLSGSRIIIYNGMNGHFRLTEFPRIVKLIKEDLKRIKK